MDTRRTPGVVLHYHAKDEFAQRLRCTFPAGSGVSTRDPFPVQLESGAMPANHGIGMHNDKNPSPIGPESPQDDPEQTVMDSQPRPRLPHRRKLLPECKVLQYQLTARSNTANQGQENGPQHFRQEWVISLKTQVGRSFGEAQRTHGVAARRRTDEGARESLLAKPGAPREPDRRRDAAKWLESPVSWDTVWQARR